MHDGWFCGSASPDRHLERVDDELGAFFARQPLTVTTNDRSLLDPVPQASRADPEILRDVIQRLRMFDA
jgi:hypothetical protein